MDIISKSNVKRRACVSHNLQTKADVETVFSSSSNSLLFHRHTHTDLFAMFSCWFQSIVRCLVCSPRGWCRSIWRSLRLWPKTWTLLPAHSMALPALTCFAFFSFSSFPFLSALQNLHYCVICMPSLWNSLIAFGRFLNKLRPDHLSSLPDQLPVTVFVIAVLHKLGLD